MGKGDKKTKRGKIILGSFGVRRPRRPKALIPAIVIKEKVEKKKVEKSKPTIAKEEVLELAPKPILTEVAGKAEEISTESQKKVEKVKQTSEKPHAEAPKKVTAPTKAPKESVASEKKTTKPRSPRKDTAKEAKPTEKPIG
jgi:30S ribosomal protein S31